MAFAKQLLGLDFNPYALDVLLVYPYDAQAACGLYAEICDLMKEGDAHAKVRAGAKILNIAAGKTRRRSCVNCASTIPTCRSSRRAARRPRASARPSPPAPTPSSGRRLRHSSYRPT